MGKIKKEIANLLRPIFEMLKSDRFSRPSLNHLDKKLEEYMNFNQGIFLEVGANDGFKQSNTYYYERLRNWKGVLIEPIPTLFTRCKKLRKRSEVFNYICSSPENSGLKKTIRYADLMSQVNGSLQNTNEENAHISRGIEIQDLNNSFKVDIECKTLSEIIDKSGFERFDFMSIDVEGHELQVLKGLDLNRHAPTYLLIETWDHERQEIIDYLDNYFFIEKYLTHKDILFKTK
ncbi:MAG TPA: FkbM family methyltransferase [Bacteroidales bacterium]|nr:FkbM family methyltransferase [Bacteroidales bacterium]